MIKVKTLEYIFYYVTLKYITLLILNFFQSQVFLVSRNDDAFKKVRSNTEEQFPTDDDILVSKSRPSYIASQYPLKPVEGILLLQFIFN